MRLWGQIYTDGQKTAEHLTAVNIRKKTELHGHDDIIINALSMLAHEMDLGRPVIVKKHISDLHKFGRTVFLPYDFMEDVDFDRFIAELIPDADD